MTRFASETGLTPKSLLVWLDKLRERHANMGNEMAKAAFRKCGSFPYNPDVILEQIATDMPSLIADYTEQETETKAHHHSFPEQEHFAGLSTSQDGQDTVEKYSTEISTSQEGQDSVDDPDSVLHMPPLTMKDLEIDLTGSPSKYRFEEDMISCKRLKVWNDRQTAKNLKQAKDCELVVSEATQRALDCFKKMSTLLRCVLEERSDPKVSEALFQIEMSRRDLDIATAKELEAREIYYQDLVITQSIHDMYIKIIENHYLYGAYQNMARKCEILKRKQSEQEEE